MAYVCYTFGTKCFTFDIRSLRFCLRVLPFGGLRVSYVCYKMPYVCYAIVALHLLYVFTFITLQATVVTNFKKIHNLHLLRPLSICVFIYTYVYIMSYVFILLHFAIYNLIVVHI